MEYLSGHAELLLDGAPIAVKVPVGSRHYPLACFRVILHYTLHMPDQISVFKAACMVILTDGRGLTMEKCLMV